MKTVLFWILAIVITLGASIYQRFTGPTYDKNVELSIENTNYQFKLTRSHGGLLDCKIELEIPDTEINGLLKYRLYPTNNDWTELIMKRQNNTLSAELPHQPPAGKVEYKIELKKNGQTYQLNEGKPVVVRFKGDVPAYVLIPHIIFIFLAMLISNLTGIMAVFSHKKFRFYGNLTLLTLFLGGLVFGPWVQWYAFGEAWAGVPFAWDLTDNKTLFAFLFWLLAVIMNRKKERPVYSIIAAIVMLIIFSIPHSMFGSELNPETGEIIQGWIKIIT